MHGISVRCTFVSEPWPSSRPLAVLSGVVSGAGKQTRAVVVNALAYWALALPAALLLAFPLGGGVEGLYGGMVAGPATQCALYAWLLCRLRWREEAAAARQRALGAVAGG